MIWLEEELDEDIKPKAFQSYNESMLAQIQIIRLLRELKEIGLQITERLGDEK